MTPSVRFVRVPDLGATILTTTLNGTVTADRVELRPGTIAYTSTGPGNRTLTDSGDNAVVTAANIVAGTLTIAGTTGSATLNGTVNNTTGPEAARFVSVPGGINPRYTFNTCTAGTSCSTPTPTPMRFR